VSLVPAFELGVWNAWIFILPLLTLEVIGSRIFGKRGSEGPSDRTRKEKMLDSVAVVIFFASCAYAVFLPLELGTFLFYAGSLFYILGMLIVTTALLSFHTTPVDKPVTKWIYRFSRNPMYLGLFLVSIGIGIACASWVFLLLTAVFIILTSTSVALEERFCLQKYGNAYREYMNRIPRWIGIPKSEKID